MSQVYTGGVSTTPTVPTSFVTDSGTATPASNTLNLVGGTSTTNDTDGIRATGAGDTATIQLTNRFYGTGSTAGNATDDIVTFDLGASAQVFRFRFEVIGRDTGNGDGYGYTITSTFQTDGAAATRINTPYSEDDETASGASDAAVDMVASGNNAILRVTGVTGRTISWAATGEYLQI